MFVSLNLFTFPFRSVVLVWNPWLPENAYLNLAVNRLFFPFTRSIDSFCLTALTLAGQVPPVPVCTLLWLVPQTVSCQSHIRLTSYWRQAGLQAVQALDQWQASIYWTQIVSTNKLLDQNRFVGGGMGLGGTKSCVLIRSQLMEPLTICSSEAIICHYFESRLISYQQIHFNW